MKRSEMIKLICRHVTENVKYYYRNGIEFPEHEADQLLRAMEEAGMQPPAYFDIQYYDEPECDGMISEWEPEEKTS